MWPFRAQRLTGRLGGADGLGTAGPWATWALELGCRSLQERGCVPGAPTPCPLLELPHTLYPVGHAGTKQRDSSC